MPDEQKRDANDIAAQEGPEALRAQAEAGAEEALAQAARDAGLQTLTELRAKYGSEYRRPVIEGLLRQGETMNIVAPPKRGKSWLVDGLALSAVAGRPWLCPRWYCTPGNVAIIDNELHPETISARLKQVREKMGLDESLEDRVSICALRGRWTPLNGLKQVIQHLRRVQPVLLILDSLYRFLPEGSSENDNAAMAQVYNQIDQFAAMLETTGVVIIHHASKGGQFDKGITDVGRGAGAIAGATDTHLILREHEEPDCFVAEAVCRTWPKPDPVTIKWACPVWETTEHDPEKLKGVRPKNAKDKPPDSLNDAAFVSYLTGQWISPRNLVPLIAERENWGEKNTRRLVDSVISAHGLDELTREDGAKDCGTFLAERNPSCPGLRFKAKVTQ